MPRRSEAQIIAAQEEVVSTLWDFARALATRPHDTMSENSDGSNGVTVNLDAVHEALERITKAYGFATRSIQ